MRTAIYPGSFDPITRGHIDVIERAGLVFDRLVVAVLVNTRKSASIDAAERAEMIREALLEELDADARSRIEVITFQGLTVDLARQRDATSIVRGLRALSDFENEQAIAHLNRKLAPEIDTVFFMTGLEHAYLSSSLVREIAAFGGDVSAMVPDSRPSLSSRSPCHRPHVPHRAARCACRAGPPISRHQRRDGRQGGCYRSDRAAARRCT